MRKAFLCLLLLVLMTPFAHADYFTVNYNLRIPEVGTRGWNEKISNDFISIDSLLHQVSTDSAWIEDGINTFLKRNPSKVCIGTPDGTTEPSVSLDVMGSIKAHAPDGDYLLLSGDSSQSYFKWSDGVLYMQTDEGTNTSTNVFVDGKGTGYSSFRIIDGDGGGYILVTVNTSKASFTDYNLNEVVFNDDGGTDTNYRFESVSNQYMIMVDAARNCVGVGKSTPMVTMDVAGDIAASGYLTVSEDLIVGYQNTGNVGIGTLPTVSLDVAGIIHATAITADVVSVDSVLIISAETTTTVGGLVGRIQIISSDGVSKCYIPVYAGS